MGGGQTLRITASTGMPSSFLPNNVGQVVVDASETVWVSMYLARKY